MKTQVGINGFGRIGRLVLKAILERADDTLEVVAVNDLFDVKQNAHLFKYDSTYGIFPGEVAVNEANNLVINGKEIKVLLRKILEICPGVIWVLTSLLKAPAYSPLPNQNPKKAKSARMLTSFAAAQRKSSFLHLPRAKMLPS